MRQALGVSKILIVVLVLIAIVAGTLFIYGEWLKLFKLPSEEEAKFYERTLNFSFSEVSLFDQSAASTTSPSYVIYNTRGKDFNALTQSDLVGGTSISSSGTKITVLPEDQGILAMRVYAGTGHFPHIGETMKANSRITAYRVDVDANRDGYLDLLVKLDFADISRTKSDLEVPYKFSFQLYATDIGTVAVNSPANKAMGTGTKTGTIEWQITTMTDKKGYRIARVYVTQNRTEEDKVKVTSVGFGFGHGSASGGDIIYESGAKKWALDIRHDDFAKSYREVVHGLEVLRSSKDLGIAHCEATSYCAVTVGIETYFGSGDYAVDTTLYIDLIGPDGTITSLSDAVLLDDA